MKKPTHLFSFIAKRLTAPRVRHPDEWADACRVLPPGSAEPGPWRTSRTPYIIPLMRAVYDPEVSKVVAVLGAQMGKTEMLLNLAGHRLDDDPVPVLYVGPTEKQVKSMARDRVRKMLETVPTLRAKLLNKQDDGLLEKFFDGVRFGFAWAGSATELASHPAGLVLVDERDRMGYDTGGEGDPVTLAEARASTFPDGKVLVVSTPTIEGESPVWAAYLESTQHQWNWPCPDCGEYFVPRFELLKWPEDCTAFDALQAAYLECPHCAAHISDDHRHTMNSRGVFATAEQSITRTGEVNGDINPNTTAGFWVSGLCSPWRSFGQRAKVWLEASRSGEVERMQAVMNTALGELWKTAGERPSWETVAELKQPYQIDTVPSEVKIITCGVDVQANRIIYAVRGWGVGAESWGIAHGEFWGETAHPQVWENLSELLEKTWGKKQIGLMLVDSGFKPGGATAPTHRVYDFCRQWRGRVSATKGHATQDRPLYLSKVDVAVRGQVIKGGLSLWHLNTDFFKQWVHARIDWPKDQRGGWHISEGHTDDYCKQVVSESRYASSDGKVKWIKHGENHYFDCEVLNTAAAHVVQAHLLRAKETPVQASPEMPEEKQAILRSTRPAAGGGRSNFAKSW